VNDTPTAATQRAPRGMYLDDFKPGQRFVSPAITVTEDAIVDFALSFDPQPFHISRTDAEAHAFGKLFASGIHSFSILFRLFWEAGILRDCAYAGIGIDNMRWLKPVFPGDTLHGEFEVLDVKPSGSKPHLGTLSMRHPGVNQDGNAVLALDCMHLIKRHPGAADEPIEV